MIKSIYILKLNNQEVFKSFDLNQILKYLEDKNIIVNSIDELFDSSIMNGYKLVIDFVDNL